MAVYSGDDNFAGSQSTGTVSVAGETLAFASLNGGGLMNEGSTASVSGNVSNLDGAAFSVSVDWGDGQSGDCGNGGQPFYFAAGTTSFSISHYYNTVGGYTLDVTAAASDGRQVEDNTSVSLTVVGVVPKVILIEPPEPPDGWDPNTEYTVSAVAYSPDSGSLSYQWTLEGTTVLSTGASVTITGAEFDDTWLTVSSGAGPATTVALCDPNNSMGVFTSVPPLSTVTITESDTGGMVFEGDVATFHVHAEWTWPAGRPTVFYSTMDPSGAAPTDYVSSDGPQAVEFGAATYDSDTGTWRRGRDDRGEYHRRDRRRRGRERDGATDASVYGSVRRRRHRDGDDRASGGGRNFAWRTGGRDRSA